MINDPAQLMKLAETAAVDENRIMPSERKYNQIRATVSLEEAISRMQSRKKGTMEKLAGGIDDESEKARKGYRDPDDGSSDPSPVVDTDSIPIPSKPQTAVTPVKKRQGRQSGQQKFSVVEVMEGINTLHSLISGLSGMVKTLVNRKQETQPEKPKDILSEFKSGSHRVTFLVNGMEFTVKCLNMIKDETAHTLVLAFDDDGDSFFAPPVQSELQIRYDGEQEPGKLFYFGMCFSLKDLGLKFLGFLHDESKGSTEA